ncbi:lactate dehydrogenase [Ktedonobacter sp. SOSP1-85]|uniref:FAD-binding oxidoreductase n=1 Tax=Ktedonobacter sp. SOSP1-85 TaxID=2778367 RepID=UPI001916A9C8|nr:FAD-binding oxidoreductase [Ktedonobacter sp. SOSP1-85]GHO74944.1 lactate dehydrogenase [Ktedonobacter sp. SOSP1-85]
MLKETAQHSLEHILPKGQVFVDRATLIAYEVDAGIDRGKPEGVVFPRTTEEVARVVRWAAQHNIPLVARGAGTGLSGGAVADRGGVIVEFAHMNHILEIETLGRSAIVEPALINLRLDEQARAHGLYFPPDPSSQRASTMGGNVAENSGGPHCFKYGVTTNYVTGLKAVLADGSIIYAGGSAFDYPEYDFCGLLTGSEGMLGMITEITVRLQRNPPGVKTMLVVFDSVEQAGVAVSAIIAAGLVPATMEMMDQKITHIIEPFAKAGLPLDAGAILIIEVDGYTESLGTQIHEIEQILLTNGGKNIRIANSEDERARIWLARKSAAGAVTRLSPSYYTVDVTVPRSRLAETLSEVNQIIERHNLRAGHLLHAGDGNLHPMILVPEPGNPELMHRVHMAGRDMVQCCVEKGGSLSGEHGIGIEKREFMTLMHKPHELMAMWDIKQAFDPKNILNPGKLFPSPEPGSQAPFKGYTLDYQDATTNRETPEHVFTPENAEDAVQGLLALAEGRQKAYINHKRLQQPGVQISTANMRGIKEYARDDMYITVGAGTTLREIQDFLAEEKKQLPITSPWPDATIGGIIASNVNAPLRMRYGSIRDLVLYATVALSDGRVIRTGRPIVKNVAGYDITRLFVGSYGTLGLMSDITLKVSSLPRQQQTLVIPVDNLQQGLNWARTALAYPLVGSGIVLYHGNQGPHIQGSPYTLVYSDEGLHEDVETELQQVQEALREAGAPEAQIVENWSATNAWEQFLRREGTHVRVGVSPRKAFSYIRQQQAVLERDDYMVDFNSGHIYAASQDESVPSTQAWVEELRTPALQQDGYALVTALPDAFNGHIERWGYQPDGLKVMQALKQRWDPQSVLTSGIGFLEV